jgi:hypothetical protein
MFIKGKMRVNRKVSIACNDLKDPLVSIVTEKKHNLRFSKSPFDITENYNPFVRKGFVSMIHNITNLQPIKILRETGASQALKGREVITV